MIEAGGTLFSGLHFGWKLKGKFLMGLSNISPSIVSFLYLSHGFRTVSIVRIEFLRQNE